jgi:hypothetical protein
MSWRGDVEGDAERVQRQGVASVVLDDYDSGGRSELQRSWADGVDRRWVVMDRR